MLKEAGIGTYILFQETYHKESYEKASPHRSEAQITTTTPKPWTVLWKGVLTM